MKKNTRVTLATILTVVGVGGLIAANHVGGDGATPIAVVSAIILSLSAILAVL